MKINKTKENILKIENLEKNNREALEDLNNQIEEKDKQINDELNKLRKDIFDKKMKSININDKKIVMKSFNKSKMI